MFLSRDFIRTVKYHVPQQGLYVYARTEEGRTELIVLNSTDNEQILNNNHFKGLVNECVRGKEIASGKTIDLTKNIVVPARKSVIIEC